MVYARGIRSSRQPEKCRTSSDCPRKEKGKLTKRTVKKAKKILTPEKVVTYFHVGESGKDDLEKYMQGSKRHQLQVFMQEDLPDMDICDIVNGLDQSGTSTDFSDEAHRCTVACPIGCQGHLRPNEVMIYEGIEVKGVLVDRRRYRARFILPTSPTRNKRTKKVSKSRDTESKVSPQDHEIGEPLPTAYSALLQAGPVDAQVQQEHAWNAGDISVHLTMKTSTHQTIRRQPVTQSTDAVRGKKGYSRGVHVFEVGWPVRMRGTHAGVGVATRDAPLQAPGYCTLIGNNSSSWGWDIGRKESVHNKECTRYPASVRNHYEYTVPESFHMIIDLDEGTLSFAVGSKWLGVAHSDLLGRTVYPAVSTVWGHAEVSLRYIGSSIPIS